MCTANYKPASDYHWAKLLLLVGILLGIECARSVDYLSFPSLVAEDGWMVGECYAQPRPDIILAAHAGATKVLSYAIAFSVHYVPIRLVPYWMTIWPLAMSVLAHAVFYLRRFRSLCESDAHRFLICVLLMLWPLGHVYLHVLTDAIFWHGHLVLVLILLAPPGRNIAIESGLFLLLAVCVVSTPLSLLTLPLALCNAVMYRSALNWVRNLLFAGLGLVHYVYGVAHAPLGNILAKMPDVVEIYVKRVVVEAFTGPILRGWLLDHHVPGLSLVVIGGCGSVATIAWASMLRHRGGVARRALLVMLIASVAITFASVLGRDLTYVQSSFFLRARYFLVPQFLLLVVMMLFALDKLRPALRRRFGDATGYVMLCALFVYISCISAANKEAWETPTERGKAIAGFFRSVDDFQKTKPHASRTFIFPNGEGGTWDIVIRLPQTQ